MLPDDPNAPKPKLVECPACHAQIKKEQLSRIAGRMLCPGCAAAWFEGDEDEKKKEEDE